MSRYAVGDIQGCWLSFQRLLEVIDYQKGRDQLWLVGDLVNRGPASAQVLRWAMAQGDSVVAVLGNHDIHLLARACGAAAEKKRDTLDDVLSASDREPLIDWLRHRPCMHVDGEFALVHAGLHPGWSIAAAASLAAEVEAGLRGPSWQTFVKGLVGAAPPWSESLQGADRARAILSYLVRVRTIAADGSVNPDFDGPPLEAPRGYLPWFRAPAPAWATHIPVFGHWAALGLDVGSGHIALDSGCVWGKYLTAIRLPDREMFQVKAVESAS